SHWNLGQSRKGTDRNFARPYYSDSKFSSPMKTQKLRAKQTAIPNSRWAAYAAAGAASALGGAGAAEAEIHYSGIVNHPFPGTNQVSSAYFPLNSGANLWFQHFNLGTEGAARIELLGPGGRAGETIGGLVGQFVLYGG